MCFRCGQQTKPKESLSKVHFIIYRKQKQGKLLENQSNRGRASCEGGRLEQRKMWSEMAAPLSSRPDPLMIEHSFSSVGDGGALVCKLGWIECAVCASLCASIASLITVPYGAPSPHTLCLALGPPKNPRPLFFAAFPAPQAPFFLAPVPFFERAGGFFGRRAGPDSAPAPSSHPHYRHPAT